MRLRKVFFFFEKTSPLWGCDWTLELMSLCLVSLLNILARIMNWLKRNVQKRRLLAKSKADPLETVMFDEIRLFKWDTLSLRGGSLPLLLLCQDCSLLLSLCLKTMWLTGQKGIEQSNGPLSLRHVGFWHRWLMVVFLCSTNNHFTLWKTSFLESFCCYIRCLKRPNYHIAECVFFNTAFVRFIMGRDLYYSRITKLIFFLFLNISICKSFSI